MMKNKNKGQRGGSAVKDMLTEDPDLIPSTSMVATTIGNLVSQNQVPSSGLCPYCMYMVHKLKCLQNYPYNIKNIVL